MDIEPIPPNPVQETSPTAVCDAACSQRTNQANYDAGVQLGNAIGLLIRRVIERHRKEAEAVDPNVQRLVIKYADIAFNSMMENIQTLASESDPAVRKEMIDILRPSWGPVRDMYCAYYHGQEYIDLDLSVQKCP